MNPPARKGSPEWAILRAWLDDQIEKARDRLEAASEPVAHNVTRGEIQGWRALIAAVEAETKTVMPATGYFE